MYITVPAVCIDRLFGLGIKPRKTGEETLPNIPIDYHGSFLCGLFDGDGCIHRRSRRNGTEFVFQITSGSGDFLSSVRDLVGCGFGSIRKKPNQFMGYDWTVYRKSHIRILRDMMYKNSEFSLDRKRAIIMEV
jgi:hypothetical protein